MPTVGIPAGSPTAIIDQTASSRKNTYTVLGKTYQVMADSRGYTEIGIASWYGEEFHGRKTSSGEIYNMYALTAAHRSLPLPTYVKVTNLGNRRHIIVKVNDRGPFHDDRLIDLSFKAAQDLGFSDAGTVAVVVESVDYLNHASTVATSANSSATSSVKSTVTPSVDEPEKSSTYYLQLGAFSGREGAETLMQHVKQLMDDHDAYAEININILESAEESSILHKVRMGPLSSEQEREEVVVLVEDAQLGTPIRIEVE